MPAALNLDRVIGRKTTLYLTWNLAEIWSTGRILRLRLRNGGELELDSAEVRRVVLCGKPNVPASVLYRLLRLNIAADWLDVFGKPLGQFLPITGASRFALSHQAEFRGTEAAFELARRLLLAKADNCHAATRRRIEDWTGWRELRKGIGEAQNPESLRGNEGAAARFYFSRWNGILHKFSWEGRHSHPAPDPVNMLLSLGYSLIYNRLASALYHSGLDARLGFFHAGRGSHWALASDLMEPLRALVDARVLSLARRQELAPEDFRMHGERCVCANGKIFAKLLGEFEEMFEEEHKFYTDPLDRDEVISRSLNDILDDLAEGFAAHIHDGHGCIIPRLAPCAAI